MDSLDRTNVFQMKVCMATMQAHVIEDLEPKDKVEVEKEIMTLWAEGGDNCSLIYSGAPSTAKALVLKGHENFGDILKRTLQSVKRYGA